MTKPDSSELERYLAGDHPLSRHYREAADESPPPELDARMRAAAREAVVPRRTRWLRPLAAAAVLVLGVGLVFQLQRRLPVVQESVPIAAPAPDRATRSPERRDAASTTALQREAPARERGTAAPPQVKSFAGPSALAPESAQSPSGAKAEAWLKRIGSLLEAGQRTAATEELRRFAQRYPDYPLPADLQVLAREIQRKN